MRPNSPFFSRVAGIAEGIETALAASAYFEMPVWAALNTSLLKKWVPPEGCKEIAIFGDNDANYSGQQAAFELAHKLARKGFKVTVHIPKIADTDWADVWAEWCRENDRGKNSDLERVKVESYLQETE